MTVLSVICIGIVALFILIANGSLLFHACQRYHGWRCMCLILLSFVIAYIIISLVVDVANYYYEIPDFFWQLNDE